MTKDEALKRILQAFVRYYNVKTEGVEPPFCAEAEFKAHNEQYVLVKAAKIAEIDSNEYVFFAAEDLLAPECFAELDSCAWRAGLGRVAPYNGHRNSDVVLVIVAGKIEAEAAALIKKAKHYKSYKLGLWGWSSYRLAALELESGAVYCNRLGRDLKKLVAKALAAAGEGAPQER